VTRCKAPEPECQVVCDKVHCSEECHKPNCPKPKCELVCENPHCSPLVECCRCENGNLSLPSEGIFKIGEESPACCSCGDNQAIVNIPNDI
jgi:hypothetical protein